MRNFIKNPLRLLCLLALSTSFVSPVRAEESSSEASTCGVPVCDVAAYVTELRGLGTTAREQKILKEFPGFLNEHRKTKDLAVWQNLAELGEQTKLLVVELEDADYVVREAANMIDVSILGIFRFGPATADSLYASYEKLSSAGRRYEALAVWDLLEKEQNIEVVQAVVEFAVKAEALSRKLDDAEWIINKAKSIAVIGSARIASLDPVVEAQYNVRLVKDANFDTHCTELDGIDTLVVANWMTAEGLVASLMNRKIGSHRAYFKNLVVSEGATRIRAQSLSSGTSSRMSLKLDKNAGTIVGSYTSTRLGCTYRLEGTRIHTPGMYIRDGVLQLEVKPTLESVLGIYKATFTPDNKNSTPKTGRFIIRAHQQPNGSVLAASFINANYSQDFQFGYLVGPRAFMVFNSGSGEQTLTRWDMAYRPDANGNYAWRGRMFSLLNGVMGSIVLEKISDLGADEE